MTTSTDPVEIEDDEARAILAMTRHLGAFVGSLDHSGSSCEDFRNGFLAGLASRCFGDAMLELLTRRPILGLISYEYPSWGGLRRAEIERLLKSYHPPTEELDEDLESGSMIC